MIGPSKILTVSYGTFSCTLEGFDDPFNTMKAIAEYFRDLAAGDRYFGATPPTPDAEMLHRIAEREIHRRVEARVSEHGIVLRAGDEPAHGPVAVPAVAAEASRLPATETSAAALATAAIPAVARAAEPEPMPEPMAEEDMAARPDSVFAEEIAFAPAEPGSVADHDGSDVAAKLSRIRAVIAAAQAAKAAPATPAADPEVAFEDEDESLAAEPADFAPAATPAGFEPATAMDEDFGFDLDLDDLPATRPAEPAAEAAEEEIAAGPAEELAPKPVEGPVAEAVGLAEEVAPEPAEEPVAVVAEEEIAAELAEEVAPEPVEEPVAEAAEEEVAAELAEEVAPEPAGEPVAEAAEEEVAAEADAPIDDDEFTALAVATLIGAQAAGEPTIPADIRAGAGEALHAAEPLDLAGWRVAPAPEDEPDAWEDETLADHAPDASGPDDEADAEDLAPVERRPGFFERARAKVIRLRHGTVAAPLPPATPEPAALAESPVPAAAEATDETTDGAGDEARHAAVFAALHDADEDEAAFEEETAALPAETGAEETGSGESATEEDEDAALRAAIGAVEEDEAEIDDLAELAREARRDAHEGRAILEDHAGDGEASVERLMEEARSKLEGDESRRRISAIAHLKAAVAATVADRKLKAQDMADEAAEVEDIDRYRDDLSKAVRPRRPTTEGAAVTRRPELSDRPAPLVLVSEQRVDSPEDAVRPAAVIRPRRVGSAVPPPAAAEEDDTDGEPLSPEAAKSFAEFADRLGATDLAELLEAAAAYTATVEGMPHFSRPQILKKVALFAEEEEFTREDELRSFGMLLRQGKIQKISRGQFTITEASRFMSEARRAAR